CQLAHAACECVITECADKMRGHALARAGDRLVEALATGAGIEVAKPGFAGHRKARGAPDHVLVVAADNDDARGHGVQPASWVSTPAIVAVMKVASEPPSTAFRPKRASSARRSGASEPMPPIWIAIELKLAKPHSA